MRKNPLVFSSSRTGSSENSSPVTSAWDQTALKAIPVHEATPTCSASVSTSLEFINLFFDYITLFNHLSQILLQIAHYLPGGWNRQNKINVGRRAFINFINGKLKENLSKVPMDPSSSPTFPPHHVTQSQYEFSFPGSIFSYVNI